MTTGLFCLCLPVRVSSASAERSILSRSDHRRACPAVGMASKAEDIQFDCQTIADWPALLYEATP